MPRKERLLKIVANGGESPVSTRGRIPTKDLSGTYQHRVSHEAPEKPARVAKHSTMNRLWDEIIPELAESGMISKADGPALELMLTHFVMSIKAANEVLSEGTTIINIKGDSVKHPSDQIFRGNSELFLKYADKLGATFASRARTRVNPSGVDDDSDNPFG